MVRWGGAGLGDADVGGHLTVRVAANCLEAALVAEELHDRIRDGIDQGDAVWGAVLDARPGEKRGAECGAVLRWDGAAKREFAIGAAVCTVVENEFVGGEVGAGSARDLDALIRVVAGVVDLVDEDRLSAGGREQQGERRHD